MFVFWHTTRYDFSSSSFLFLPFYLSPFYDVLRLMTLFVSKTEQTVCNIISYLVDTWAFTFTSVSTIKYNFYQYCTCDSP